MFNREYIAFKNNARNNVHPLWRGAALPVSPDDAMNSDLSEDVSLIITLKLPWVRTGQGILCGEEDEG